MMMSYLPTHPPLERDSISHNLCDPVTNNPMGHHNLPLSTTMTHWHTHSVKNGIFLNYTKSVHKFNFKLFIVYLTFFIKFDEFLCKHEKYVLPFLTFASVSILSHTPKSSANLRERLSCRTITRFEISSGGRFPLWGSK